MGVVKVFMCKELWENVIVCYFFYGILIEFDVCLFEFKLVVDVVWVNGDCKEFVKFWNVK